MNKTSFRKVFSKRLGALVAVAETARSHGKEPGSSPGNFGGGGKTLMSTPAAIAPALRGLPFARLAVLTTALAAVWSPAVQAQSVWTGGASTDWFTAANWNPAAVPGLGTGLVQINTSTPSAPTLVLDGTIAGTWAASIDALSIGDAAGANGKLTLIQSGAYIYEPVYDPRESELNVHGGGVIGANGGTGVLEANMSGPMNHLNFNAGLDEGGDPAPLVIGQGAGSNGRLTLNLQATEIAEDDGGAAQYNGSGDGRLDLNGGALTIGTAGGIGVLEANALGLDDIDADLGITNVGALTVGAGGGNGTIKLQVNGSEDNGSSLDISAASVVIGDGAGSQGRIEASVSGFSSLDLNSNAGKVIVGLNGGTGAIDVDLKNATTDYGSSALDVRGNLLVGVGAGSTGKVNVLSAGKSDGLGAYSGINFGTGTTIVGDEGGTGAVTIDGPGWRLTQDFDYSAETRVFGLHVGRGAGSTGEVNILGGGKIAIGDSSGDSADPDQTVDPFGAVIGEAGGTGTLTVSGVSENNADTHSELRGGDGVTVGIGAGSVGTLNAWNGGRVVSINKSAFDSNDETERPPATRIGVDGGTGSVLVSGAGSWLLAGAGVSENGESGVDATTGDLHVGVGGAGSLTIADEGLVHVGRLQVIPGENQGYDYVPGEADGIVYLASGAGSSGTINFGAAAGQPAAAPGTLAAAGIVFGEGAGKVVFNHTGDMTLDQPLSGTGAIEVYAGTTTIDKDNRAGFVNQRVDAVPMLYEPGFPEYGSYLAPAEVSQTFEDGFHGATRLHGGTLVLNNDGALGDSTIQAVEGTPTLRYGVNTAGETGGGLLAAASNGVTIANPIEVSPGVVLRQEVLEAMSATQSGVISGAGGIEKIGAGTLTLTGANTYEGATTVATGTLRAGAVNTLSAASAVTVAAAGTLDLAGFSQTVGGVHNAGLVNMGTSTAPGAVLTVAGDYVGNGGTVAFNTVLAADDSATDKLVVQGAVSGQSKIAVINAGGGGALTTGNGIELVQARGGSTADAFALGSRVAAGAYEYRLYQGGIGAEAGNPNWYLRSTVDCSIDPSALACSDGGEAGGGGGGGGGGGIPTYRPEVVVDTAIAALASRIGLATLGTWHERTGGSTSSVGSTPMAGWGRLFGQTGSVGKGFGGSVAERNAAFENRGSSYDFSYSGFEAGMDLLRNAGSDGSHDLAGFYVGSAHASGDVDAVMNLGWGSRAGSLSMDSYTLGGYYTHIAPSGWYVDTVLQGTRYSDVKATSQTTESQTFETSGRGITASVEGGLPIALGNDWTIEPQAQLVYQDLSFDDGADAFGGIGFGSSNAVYGRVAGRLQKELVNADGTKTSLWARASLWSDFGSQAKTTFTNLQGGNPTTLKTDLGGDWAQVDVGVSGQLSRSVTAFGVANYSQTLGGGRGHSWGARAGLKVSW